MLFCGVRGGNKGVCVVVREREEYIVTNFSLFVRQKFGGKEVVISLLTKARSTFRRRRRRRRGNTIQNGETKESTSAARGEREDGGCG